MMMFRLCRYTAEKCAFLHQFNAVLCIDWLSYLFLRIDILITGMANIKSKLDD